MSVVHPIQEIGEQLERVFSAIETNDIPEEIPEVRDPDDDHTWFPNVEIADAEDEYVVKVSLSGLDPDEAEVMIQKRLLVLRSRPGPRWQKQVDPAQSVIDEANLSEETLEDYGECLYQMPLPANVEAEGVAAEFVEDTLEIHLPKLQ